MKLDSLLTAVKRRMINLEIVARRAAALPIDDFERERLAGHLTIELHNLNSEWIRRYYIEVSTNKAIRVNGRRIVIGMKQQSADDAISYAIWKISGADKRSRWIAERNRFYEPSWGSVNTLPRLAVMLNFPDRNKITTALSAARDSLGLLRLARNYYAHRNIDTRAAFFAEMHNRFNLQPFNAPSAGILNRRVGAFSNVFLFWLNDLERVNAEVCSS
jgi:hypothetical protein